MALSLLGGVRAAAGTIPPEPVRAGEELLKTGGEVGRYGGRLAVALRAEPKTLNPVIAADNPSRTVVWQMIADLIHINRLTQRTESALAKSWSVSPDGRRYTLQLRHGLRFSDGHAVDADDVVFSFQVYLDEKVNAPQRDLLIVGGKPIAVRKLAADKVEFELAEPYAAAERLFDGLAILPRHLLEKAYREGTFAQAWNLATPPAAIAGLGPFRLKEYVPGQRLVLERNPYYWKEDRQGHRLPFLDELTFLFVPSEDAQVIRFQAGETDVLSRFNASNFGVLEAQQQARNFRLYDLGPGLEYNFLFFNLNDLGPNANPELRTSQAWFREVRFRQAVSAAVDRDAVVRLVYHGRGAPLWGPVSPGYKLWQDAALPQPARSLDRARQLLRDAGFSWNGERTLVDRRGAAVEFSIVTSASNAERSKMATLLQADLGELGMRVHVVPLEFRTLLGRVLQSHDYEACVLGLGSGDADPNSSINVWLSSGAQHLWHLDEAQPATPWEAEIDRLMKQQLTALRYKDRKRLYDGVQRLLWEDLPLVCLATPHVLVGAKSGLGNLQPAVMEDSALWNSEELFWRSPPGASR
jgi:peptide/nickel transport system substrate-binding protein